MNSREIVLSGRLSDFTGFDAVRANGDALDTSVDDCAHFLQVRLEPSRRPVVCVTDVVPGHRFLAADFANSCHFATPSDTVNLNRN